MSQQPPPYGPQQPYQQPYPAYSPGGHPHPYQAYPQRRDNTTRNVLLIIGGVMLLLCGGVAAFFVWVVNSVEDGFDADFRGSSSDPIVVEEGEAFSIRGFDYEAGWRVTDGGPTGDVTVAPVRGTNNRADEEAESVFLHFRIYRDNELLTTVDCSGGSDVAAGRSVTLDCSSFDPTDDVSGYDEIEVYDSSLFD